MKLEVYYLYEFFDYEIDLYTSLYYW